MSLMNYKMSDILFFMCFRPVPTCNVYESVAILPPGSEEARFMSGEPFTGRVLLPMFCFALQQIQTFSI